MPQIGLKRGVVAGQMDDSNGWRWYPFTRKSKIQRRDLLADPGDDDWSEFDQDPDVSFTDRVTRVLAKVKLSNQKTSKPKNNRDGFEVLGQHSVGLRASKNSEFEMMKRRVQFKEMQQRAYQEKQRLLNSVLESEEREESLRQKELQQTLVNQISKRHLNQVKSLATYTAGTGSGAKPSQSVLQLTKEQSSKVDQAFMQARRTPQAVLVDAFKIDLRFSDFSTLGPRQWLNDNVIDMYLNIVTSSTSGSQPRSAVFTTHFFTKLDQDGYSGVRRWALRKKLDIFEPDYVFVPVNQHNTHWTLAVINNRDMQLEFYDSLPSGKGSRELAVLVTFMEGEAKRLNKPANIVSKYQLKPHINAPKQSNGYDCGVFMCEVAARLARGASLNHSQREMDSVRRYMAYCILALKKDAKM